MRVGRPKMSAAKVGRSWSLDDSLSATAKPIYPELHKETGGRPKH